MDQQPQSNSKKSGPSRLLLIMLPLFLFGTIGIDMLGWMKEFLCNPVLGCDSGFFGYDALMHVLGGAVIVSVLVWFMRTYPAYSLFGQSFWKDVIILISLVMFIEVGWELLEFSIDHLRIYALNHFIPPQFLAQPGIADTMGDFVFSFVGGAIMIAIEKGVDRKSV